MKEVLNSPFLQKDQKSLFGLQHTMSDRVGQKGAENLNLKCYISVAKSLESNNEAQEVKVTHKCGTDC